MSNVAKKIGELGLTLPPAPKPVGSYVPFLVSGKTVFVSGQVSKRASGEILTGKLGAGLNIEQGKEAARLAALSALSILEAGLGLDQIFRITRVAGFVQTAPDFYGISDVINGASDLLLQIFGENGKHVRCAIGAHTLPLNAAVEIELTAELK